MVIRRLRGVASLALSWSAVWTVLEATYAIFRPGEPGGIQPPRWGIHLDALNLIPGALAGVVFALLVMSSRRRQVSDFSLKEFALFGVMGGMLVPVVALTIRAVLTGRGFGWAGEMLAEYALSGAGCATATLMLARCAPLVERQSSPDAILERAP